MALTAMFNFDVVPGQADNTAGLNQPVHTVGLAPYANNYGFAFTTATSTNESLGVTGVAADKFANGANALVFFSRTPANAPAISWQAGTAPMSSSIAFRYSVGFRFKIPTGNPTSLPFLHVLLSTPQYPAILQFTTTYELSFMGTTLTFKPAFGQEYYFEVVIDYQNPSGASTYQPTASLYIDGVLIRSGLTFAISGVNNCTWRLGLVSSGVNSNQIYRRWLVGDIYSTNMTGDAPGNNRLGPQYCRLAPVDELVANTWTPSEGTDPLALVTGANARNDAKFLTAPDDDGATSYKLNFPTNAKSIVNGVFFFARARREAGQARGVVGRFTKGDDTLIAESALAPVQTTFSDSLVLAYAPTNAAEAANLRDNVLQNATFSLKAPVPSL